MKKTLAYFLISLLILTVYFCGKDKKNPDANKNTATKESNGNKGGSSKGKQIDVDKLDIPERMKKAIKEGKIPKERIEMFLKMRRGSAPSVQIERVKKQTINAFLVLNGVVEPEKKVEVYSRLSAYVKSIVKEEGDIVRRNDILAYLDDSEIKIGYQQARIQLSQADISLKDEKENHERNLALKKDDLITEKDLQTSELNYKKAKLEYENKLEEFRNLELQMNYTKIKSPVEGYVTERMIEVGDKVNNNQQVYTVEDFSPLLIKVYVPTSDIINIQKGMDSEVSSDILKGVKFNGKIKLINPRIDVQSGTVKVTVEVFDESGKLKPGMFVEVKIVISNKTDALVVPKKSIVYKKNKTFVFIFDKMQVFQREIKTGISEGDNIEIIEGLEQGDTIVTVGVETLKDKMRVNVIR